MSDVFPPSVQGAGTVRVQYVTTLADPAVPVITEVNAVSSLYASPYIRSADLQITHEQEKIDDTRLSDVTKREALGQSSFAVDQLTYVHNPQAAPDAAGNKAYDTFTPGDNGYFIVRFGTKALLAGAAFVAAQRVQVYAVQFGDQHQPIPSGDNAVHVIQQQITLSRVTGDVAIAAGP